MRKMKCLFEREFHEKGRFTLLRTVTPGCEWVIAGEGRATRKFDGTAVYFDGETWFRRYDSKKGIHCFCFFPCEPEPDPITKHWPGWTPVNMGQEDTYIREAIENFRQDNYARKGTYEACGPKINGNNEGFNHHHLVKHGECALIDGIDAPDRNFDAIKEWLKEHMIEGLVYHHPDGRMCKIRRSDFGFEWGKR